MTGPASISRRSFDWAKPVAGYTLAECSEALALLGADIEGIEGRLRDLGELDFWCDVHGDLSAFESPGSAIRKSASDLLDHEADES